jgi:hypothetical protein
LGTKVTPDEFRNSMIELAIDALVIIALGITMRILVKPGNQPAEAEGAPGSSQPPEGGDVP